MATPNDLAGWRTGMLTVLSRTANTDRGAAQWLCQCTCGRYHIARADNLLQGKVKRCATCGLVNVRATRIEAWYHLSLHPSAGGGMTEGQAGFARVWQGGVELGAPIWIDRPRTHRYVVLIETVRHLIQAGALELDRGTTPVCRWLYRRRAATTHHSHNEGHAVWAAWADLTGEWKGPVEALPIEGEPDGENP